MSDGKDPRALRTIGEVAEALDVRQHVLRYWEQQFPMLQPLKRAGGRRYYRREDVALVSRIDRLINREGYTLKGARAAIERSPGDGGDRSGPAPGVGKDELLPTLQRIRDRLAAALDA